MQPLSFEAVGTFMEISIPSATKSEEIHLGVSIQGGNQKVSFRIKNDNLLGGTIFYNNEIYIIL